MKTIRDICYYQDQKLDVFVPEGKISKVFVHFHGGGIVSGDKSDVEDLVMHLVNQGFLVFNVNYSLYPNTKFPEFLYEAAHAVKYAFEHANEYGTSAEIYLSGQSAGAYIIMMLCMNKEYLESVGLSPLDIKGYISDSGQMIDHFNVQHYELGVDPWLQRITKLSPMYFVNPDAKISPVLLVYYSNDMLNRKEQNIMFYNLVKHYNKSADIEHIELPGEHVVGSCHKDEDGEYPFVKVILGWLSKR